MKKNILLIFIIGFVCSCTTDNDVQSFPIVVHQGNIILKTQADVDAIGAQGYNVINGYLNIGDRWTDNEPPTPSDITDLSPLQSLTQITKQLEIQSNPMLTSLNGLDNITAVSGIIVNDNENLTSLSGLENVTTITGNFIATGQNILNGGVISLFNNTNLTSIAALENIRPQTLHQISINTTGLTSLEGLASIVSVSNLTIVNNDQLTSLAALEGLSSVENAVFITDNDNLTNYCRLQTSLQTTILSIYNVLDNQFNPTQQNIIDGNCSE